MGRGEGFGFYGGDLRKDFRFRLFGDWTGASSCLETLEKFTVSDWDRFTYRQKNIVGHEHTKTIPLIFDWQRRTRKILHENYEYFSDHLNSLTDFLNDEGVFGEPKRANLVSLKAGCSIPTHFDKGDFLSGLARIHVPLITNDSCEFVVDRETKVLRFGEVWEVNNTGLPHSVANNGTTDRVHLIVDFG